MKIHESVTLNVKAVSKELLQSKRRYNVLASLILLTSFIIGSTWHAQYASITFLGAKPTLHLDASEQKARAEQDIVFLNKQRYQVNKQNLAFSYEDN